MSSDATTPSNPQNTANASAAPANGSADKGKGKLAADPVADESMDDDNDDDDDEEEDEEDDDDDMEEDEDLHAIDPSVILAPGTRRTRGVKVDYTSKEALAKAGLKEDEAADDDAEESFVAQDDEMHDD